MEGALSEESSLGALLLEESSLKELVSLEGRREEGLVSLEGRREEELVSLEGRREEGLGGMMRGKKGKICWVRLIRKSFLFLWGGSNLFGEMGWDRLGRGEEISKKSVFWVEK